MAMYIRKEDFHKALRESIANDRLTKECIDYFIKIANGITKKLKYKDPMDREDCIQGALENCVRYWKKYNPDREGANPFSYFTSVVKTGSAQVFNKLHGTKDRKMTKITIDENFNF